MCAGEYGGDTDESIQTVFTLIRQSLGELPIVDDELKRVAQLEDGTADAASDKKDTEMKAQVSKSCNKLSHVLCRSSSSSQPMERTPHNRRWCRPVAVGWVVARRQILLIHTPTDHRCAGSCLMVTFSSALLLAVCSSNLSHAMCN
jgi:hypothetical protein